MQMNVCTTHTANHNIMNMNSFPSSKRLPVHFATEGSWNAISFAHYTLHLHWLPSSKYFKLRRTQYTLLHRQPRQPISVRFFGACVVHGVVAICTSTSGSYVLITQRQRPFAHEHATVVSHRVFLRRDNANE